ncbi:uncharacterized protein BJ171DRAFT_604741 [Polychytrium aggregatum]|uniref:uncharacterized protein n=1 Tax=Polychytrium aggregatum TaxID=110093 RepID=UPI0022FE7FA2|nr:uncharacterized protein BJ171DRAFT_604741 [Polychytrium aggregatum]KAI9193165.1 hypothetical protein BJ171DRAFT_604741 [Polychytrium aggregatum]
MVDIKTSDKRQPRPNLLKPARQAPLHFRLRYLKFKCSSVVQTIDFYQSLGMSIDWQYELKPGDPRGAKTVFSLTYEQSSDSSHYHAMHLVFEHRKSLEPQQQAQQDESGRDIKKRHQYEYLVIYVHFLARLFKRLETKGFKVIMAPTDISEMKVAIFQDPNGIQWFARLGYYTIPSTQAEDTVRFFEKIFQPLDLPPLPRGEGPHGLRHSPHRNLPLSVAGKYGPRIRKTSAVAAVKHGIAQPDGFRLVDMEDFILGLTHYGYYWMGNDLRESVFTLCFTERGMAGAPPVVPTPQKNRLVSKLLAIGFEVVNLDGAINQIKKDHKDVKLDWDEEKTTIEGIGTFSRFFETTNGTWVELLQHKIEQPTKDNATTTAAPTQPKPTIDLIESLRRKSPKYVININHLRGQAKTLSEAAIEEVGLPPMMREITTAPATKEEADSALKQSEPLYFDQLVYGSSASIGKRYEESGGSSSISRSESNGSGSEESEEDDDAEEPAGDDEPGIERETEHPEGDGPNDGARKKKHKKSKTGQKKKDRAPSPRAFQPDKNKSTSLEW